MARKDDTTPAKADDAVREETEQVVDAEEEKGFRGVEVDPTPNENYTLAGVTSGAPTPETDADTAEAARKGQAEATRAASGETAKK